MRGTRRGGQGGGGSWIGLMSSMGSIRLMDVVAEVEDEDEEDVAVVVEGSVSTTFISCDVCV